MRIINFEPRINTPQSRPFAPVEKEKYKTHAFHAPQIQAISSDTAELSSDDEKHQLLIKLTMRPEYTTLPHLTHPSKLEMTTTLSDAETEKQVYASMAELRLSLNNSSNLAFSEIFHQQKVRKEIHQVRDKLLQEMEDRAQTSKVLNWVQTALTAVALVTAVLTFGVSLFVGIGGVAAAGMGALGPITSGVSGTSGAINSIYGLKTREKEGVIVVLKAEMDLLLNAINALLKTNEDTMGKIRVHESQVAANMRNWTVKIH